MKEIITRIKAETPAFFKKLQWMAGSVTAGSVALTVYYSSLPDGFKEAIPQQWIKYIIVAGAVAALVAQFTKTDK